MEGMPAPPPEGPKDELGEPPIEPEPEPLQPPAGLPPEVARFEDDGGVARAPED